MNTKHCMICQKDIDLAKDNYVRVTDYFKGQQHSEGFYHNKCYQDRLKGGNMMQKMAASLYARTNKLLDKAGGDKEVVYQIE